jgi:hypothetical protein
VLSTGTGNTVIAIASGDFNGDGNQDLAVSTTNAVIYVFHTFDESSPLPASRGKCHIVGLRTKLDLAAGRAGGKQAFYWEGGQCSTLPDTTPPDPEFYDYNPQTTNNASELGNELLSSNATLQTKIAQYAHALGSWGTAATGLIGNELAAPLVGTGTDGKRLIWNIFTARAFLDAPISPKGGRMGL